MMMSKIATSTKAKNILKMLLKMFLLLMKKKKKKKKLTAMYARMEIPPTGDLFPFCIVEILILE